MGLEIGDKAPNFCLPNQFGEEICLKDFLGKWVILYFYPKDNTPGCTREAVDFTRSLKEFEKLDAIVIGISPDSIESHKKFAEKHNIKVILLSDRDKETIKQYGVWKLKKRYGREYYGVVRSTFLINPKGVIEYIWTNVKVKGHVEDVMRKLSDARKKES